MKFINRRKLSASKSTRVVTGIFGLILAYSIPVTVHRMIDSADDSISGYGKPNILFAAIGTENDSQPKYTGRKIRVTAGKAGLMTGAMIAKDYIDFNGNGVATDSFDSEDPDYSTDGQYDPSKNKDNGDVAVNLGIINSLNIGNANILGSIAVGPGGTVEIGANGKVGDKAWMADPSKSGIQSNRFRNDMNVSFPDVEIPFTGGHSMPSGRTITNEVVTIVSETNSTTNYVVKTYDFVLDSGNYKISNLTGDILVLGDAVLYVTDNLNMNQLEIAKAARLKLYMGGSAFSLGGNKFINKTGKADNLWYFGLPSNTSISINGNSGFVGVIYAPQAHLQLNGGGNETIDLIGACLAKSTKVNGHFNFHYDESLGKNGSSRGFLIDSWNEVRLDETN